MNINEVVKLIRGKAGTVVRLKVRRTDGEPKMIDITRASIELKDSEARAEVIDLSERGRRIRDSTDKAGYRRNAVSKSRSEILEHSRQAGRHAV